MNRLSSLTKLVAGIALAGTAATASADIVDLGTVALNEPTIFQGTVANGQFNGLFAFSLPTNGGSAYSAVNVPLTITFPLPLGGSGVLNYNVLLTTLSLFSNPDGVKTHLTGDEQVLKAVNSTDPGQSSNSVSFSMASGQSPSGPLILSIMGLANGSAGGVYSGAILAVPVPEAETWAMMLVGAGLIGFRLRKQSKKAAALRLA